MEVYVLYGRVYYSEAVVDMDGNYFGESPVIEVFSTFEEAMKKLREYVVEAYHHLKECSYIVDDSFIENTTEDDLFSDYNMDELDEDIENDVCWDYTESDEHALWQMYVKNVPFGDQIPILAGLGIRKVKVDD